MSTNIAINILFQDQKRLVVQANKQWKLLDQLTLEKNQLDCICWEKSSIIAINLLGKR